MTTSNGFATVNIHEALDIWRLGNMARMWAGTPLALTSGDVELFVDLCKRYGLEPAVVLLEFQRIAFPHMAQNQVEAAVPRSPEAMPEVSGSGVSYPSPHPRHEAASGQQTVIGSPVKPSSVDTDGRPLLGYCGLPDAHEAHDWEGESEVSLDGEWYWCDGNPPIDGSEYVERAPDNDPGKWIPPTVK